MILYLLSRDTVMLFVVGEVSLIFSHCCIFGLIGALHNSCACVLSTSVTLYATVYDI